MSDTYIEKHPWEPDDMGGGFPCLQVEATIYEEEELDALIMKLLKHRPWLRKQILKCAGEL